MGGKSSKTASPPSSACTRASLSSSSSPARAGHDNKERSEQLTSYRTANDDGVALKALFTYISSLLSNSSISSSSIGASSSVNSLALASSASSSSSPSMVLLPLVPLDIISLIIDYTARRPLLMFKRAAFVGHITHVWRLPSPCMNQLQPTWQLIAGKEKTNAHGILHPSLCWCPCGSDLISVEIYIIHR